VGGDMQFWFPINMIPGADLKLITIPVGHRCVEIIIPDLCPEIGCGMTFVLHDVGSKMTRTLFSPSGYCGHFYKWKDIWNKKTALIAATQKGVPVAGTITGNTMPGSIAFFGGTPKKSNIEPVHDGMRCSGTCGSWVPMAEPNKDGSFVCYSCRTGF
jgi:hypothetical protein